jgi:hypothetical protein
MTTKKNARGVLLGTTAFRKQSLKLETAEGTLDVELRQPSVSGRSAVLKAAGISGDGRSAVDLGRLQVAAVLACAYDPETGSKLFEAADEAALLELPAGGWFDELASAALALVNVDQEDARKSSGAA